MKMQRTLALFLAFFLSAAHAEQPTVHSTGEAHARLLAKMFFPDAPMLPSPGADGLLTWKKLDGNKTDVAIHVALAVHFLPTLHAQEDPAKKNELLATLASAPQALAVRPDFPADSLQDLKRLNRPLTVGWVGHACKALLAEPLSKQGVAFVYVAYKTPQEATAAMLGGHIDATCPAAAALRQTVQNKTGKILLDITGYHGFVLTTYLFAGREMTEETKRSIVKQVTRKLTAEDHALAEANGFLLSVRTGNDAVATFERDRKIWTQIARQSSP